MTPLQRLHLLPLLLLVAAGAAEATHFTAQFVKPEREVNSNISAKHSPMRSSTLAVNRVNYDEMDAVLAARMTLAAYAGYHKKLRFATAAQLMCPSCSLPDSVNVSAIQQLDSTGAVVAASIVGRVGTELILAFAGDSPDGFNPMSGLFVLEHMESSFCAGLGVYKTPLTTWRSMQQQLMSLLALYAQGATPSAPLTLRISGYSAGAPVAAVAALNIAWALEKNGSLSSSHIRLGPVHTFGNGAMGNLEFKQCFDRWVGHPSGHFAIVHGRDPIPFLMPQSWHMLTPCVFYDGPGRNATDWQSHNFSICVEEKVGCDEKYRAWERNPVHILQGFCTYHTWYADLDAVSVYCGSTTERGCAAAFRLACSHPQEQST